MDESRNETIPVGELLITNDNLILDDENNERLVLRVYNNGSDVDIVLVNMESGEELKLHSNQIRDYYKAAIGDYFNELKLKCGQYQIDLIPADITKGFDQILLPYVLKRQKIV